MDKRAAFEAWRAERYAQTTSWCNELGEYPDEFTQGQWKAWKGALAAQKADDALDAADPLQGAADWLVKALDKPSPAEIAAHLLIGHNRAERLFDAAIAQQGKGERHENP